MPHNRSELKDATVDNLSCVPSHDLQHHIFYFDSRCFALRLVFPCWKADLPNFVEPLLQVQPQSIGRRLKDNWNPFHPCSLQSPIHHQRANAPTLIQWIDRQGVEVHDVHQTVCFEYCCRLSAERHESRSIRQSIWREVVPVPTLQGEQRTIEACVI